ncbi:Protein of unknown function (DUF3295) [Geosmithia morbida]|uniref:Nitrogen regulatory protein areA GATA-like domain-containing protein n=1 Tax=Geosmithia morbida TaxID=1094350 RepID=A0A9P5D128_9HYPO|nr:Protein of unknown function (DUF3295) [Geosmithia morbida]KAF4119450.1 Protein of unknown function (DUF3295) [Geosmithia morbida]
MPNHLDTHVLTVDADLIHKVNTENPANLYTMWTVFSRCADSVEQGRRLENLSWRLWQKKQLADLDGKTPAMTTTLQTIPSDSRLPELPQLSGSVDSLADDEAVEFTSVSAPLEIVRPRIHRQDSSTSSRSRRDRHTSSDEVEKMIVSIVKDKAPLSAPAPPKAKLATAPAQKEVENETEAVPPCQTIYRSGSTTTESQSSKTSDMHSVMSRASLDMQQTQPQPQPQPQPPQQKARTQVVRGFSPRQAPAPLLKTPEVEVTAADVAFPEPRSSPAPVVVTRTGKQPAAFALGGSYSSSEQGQSVETRQRVGPTSTPAPAPKAKTAAFKLGGSKSSEEDASSLKSALHSSRDGGHDLSAQKKQASFSSRVVTHTMEPDSAIESDSEGDYIDESAIDDDDDDSSDWEDSLEDSGKSSVDEKYFQRVDSKANLTSRRSLITLMLAQNDDRAKKLSSHASQSTSALLQGKAGPSAPTLGASPDDSDDAPLMMKGARQQRAQQQHGLKPIREGRTGAMPMAMPTQGQVYGQQALSPRTTRRNMLATELTESLRRHLLWERSQKSSTANAVLKRRHTSHDVANLRQYPERSCMKKSEDANANSMNQFFSKESFEGYHAKGW